MLPNERRGVPGVLRQHGDADFCANDKGAHSQPDRVSESLAFRVAEYEPDRVAVRGRVQRWAQERP